MYKICTVCNIQFETKTRTKTCSINCYDAQFKLKCAFCKTEFLTSNNARKFCSKSCCTSMRNKNCTIIDSWKRKYGDEWVVRYDEWLQKLSSLSAGKNNPMYGRTDHVHGLKKESNRRKGLTLEEIHGTNEALLIKSKISKSLSGENNPAYGKTYKNGGKSVKGYYKGFFFRSLFEYSFMKHLELKGLSLNTDIQYEHFIIPYELAGRKRTYRIDFYVPKEKIVYEVKPEYCLKRQTEQNILKWKAAHEFCNARGLEFKIVTENNFQKIQFDVAALDPDVSFIEKTLFLFKNHSVTC